MLEKHYSERVTVKRLILILVLLWLGAGISWFAQGADPDRLLFERTKAKADKGDPEAELELGSLYANGTGVTRDQFRAIRWHRKAAEQGSARAQYQMGLDYVNGVGVKPDLFQAVQWFQKAAKQGYAEAQTELGMCYLEGAGIVEDAHQAAEWFRKAADQGLVRAQYELGHCYLEGNGVTKDLVEALKWLQKAAEAGSGPAQASLGHCYETGTGVAKDYVAAYKWYNLAAAHGDEKAVENQMNVAKMETLLTPEQVTEAQRQAREFKPTEKSEPTTLPSPGAATSGSLTVQANDDSCEVFVDGAFVGNSPAKLKLTEGSHKVEVKKPGFKDYQREIKVTAGSDLNLRATLQQQ